MKSTIHILFFFLSFNAFSQSKEILWTVAWSPDNTQIAVGGNQGDLKIFSAKTFKLIKSYPVEDVILSRLKWHPFENKLAVITQSTTFKAKILDLENDTWIELKGLQNSFRALDWNYTGELLAVSGFDGEISIFDSVGNRITQFLADPKSVTGLDWHPSKNILAAAGSVIGIFDHMGDTINIFQPRKNEVLLLCVEWHPSGEYFAVGDYGKLEDAKDKRIQYWNVNAEKLIEMKNSGVEYRNIRWSPDGKSLATANDALRIWDENGILISKSEPSMDYLWGIDWSSDGSKIITTSSQGVITLWDSKANPIKQLDY